MIVAVGASDLERFRASLGRRLGLYFDDAKLGFLSEVLARRLDIAGEPAAAYLDRFETMRAGEESRALAAELTVGETYFFRNGDQFRAFSEVALPARLAARSASRRLKLLSAGCASGEEPYSLAIAVRERVVEPGWSVSIRGVDINPVQLAKAARARYSTWALRETPPEARRRWFNEDGREFALDEAIRRAVEFWERNLAHDDPELWGPETYDVVFCRNVLMYFTQEAARALVARITRALVPGGYLFLGHAETLRGLSNDYHLLHTHGTFYYQRRPGAPRAIDVALANAGGSSSFAPTLIEDIGWATSWIDTVQRTSDRIRALSERPLDPLNGPRQSATGAAPPAHATDLNVALALLEGERFHEALDVLGQMSPDSLRDPDVLLLRAVLLTHGGQLSAAQQVCSELLRLDELSAGAHYLLALCREGLGDLQGAAEHDQVAAYLDPVFAMPRLHMGLMARRAGDRQAACRDLGDALLLLQREEASRLLLFGGGFRRDALIALCRAELRSAGCPS